jgi:hypothetical protein
VLTLLLFWLVVFAWIVYVIFTKGKQMLNNTESSKLLKEEACLKLLKKAEHLKTLLKANKEDYIDRWNSIPLSQHTKMTLNYGNLFIGYKKERYYWEAVSMTAKLALIVIQNLFAYDPIVVTSFSTLVVAGMIIMQFENSPYQNYTVRKLSNFCLIV